MNDRSYSPPEIQRLRPLLRSIANELEERLRRLVALGDLLRRLEAAPRDPEEAHETRRQLVAQMASQRRALHDARAELARLGCTIATEDPVVLRIPTRLNGAVHDLVWSLQEPVPDEERPEAPETRPDR